MITSLLRWFSASRADPTTAWPTTCVGTPQLRLDDPGVGPIRFGSALDGARVFGRPDRFHAHTDKQYCELTYFSAGFQIDFDRDRMAYISYFLGPDLYVPSKKVLFCRPELSIGVTADRMWTMETIESYFGRPTAVDNGSGETVVFYTHKALTLEFELNGESRLKRLNAYPTNSL